MTHTECDSPKSTTVQGLKSAGSSAEAEERLYHSWAPGLRCYFASRGFVDAEDLAHEVLVAVIIAMRGGTLRNHLALPGFVWTVAKRRLWREIGQRARLQPIDAIPEPMHSNSDGETTVWERERREIAQRALMSLPNKSREILVRFYVRCESPEVICAAMGLTATQFRLLKSRSKATFQSCVKAKERRPLMPFSADEEYA